MRRPRHTRQTDQVIVFRDDCAYERIDPETASRTIPRRKAGETIRYSRGEDAPRLTNIGNRPDRTLVIDLRLSPRARFLQFRKQIFILL